MHSKPEAEIEISADLVRELLAEQHGDLSDRPLEHVASGWDNVIYRLGESMAIRLPRRTVSGKPPRQDQNHPRRIPPLA